MKKINFSYGKLNNTHWKNNHTKNNYFNDDQFMENGHTTQWKYNNFNKFKYHSPNYLIHQYKKQIDIPNDDYTNGSFKPLKKKIFNLKKKHKNRNNSTKILTETSILPPPPGSEEDRLRIIENSKAFIAERLKNFKKDQFPEIKSPDNSLIIKEKIPSVITVNDSDLTSLNIEDLKEIDNIEFPQITLDDDEVKDCNEEEEEEEMETIFIDDDSNQENGENLQDNEFLNKTLINQEKEKIEEINKYFIINDSENNRSQEQNKDNEKDTNNINEINVLLSSPKQSSDIHLQRLNMDTPTSPSSNNCNSIAKVLSCFNKSMKRDNKQQISPILIKRRKRNSCDSINNQDIDKEIVSRNHPCKNILKEIINNPAPGRFNFELQQLMKEKRSQLTREMRKVAQDRIQNLLRQQDNTLLSHIADDLLDDPDMAINLSTLPEEVINELTNILGIDMNNIETNDDHEDNIFLTTSLNRNLIINNSPEIISIDSLENNKTEHLEEIITNPSEENTIAPLEKNITNLIEKNNIINSLGKNQNIPLEKGNFKTLEENLILNVENNINTHMEKSIFPSLEKDIINSIEGHVSRNQENNLQIHMENDDDSSLNIHNKPKIRVKQEFREQNNSNTIESYLNYLSSQSQNNDIHNYSSKSSIQIQKTFHDISTQTISINEEELNPLPTTLNNVTLILKRMDLLESQNNELRTLILSLKQDFIKLNKTSLKQLSSLSSNSIHSINQSPNKKNKKKSPKLNKKKPLNTKIIKPSIIVIEDENPKDILKKNKKIIKEKVVSTCTSAETITTEEVISSSQSSIKIPLISSIKNMSTIINSNDTDSCSSLIFEEGPQRSINCLQSFSHKILNRVLLAGCEDGFIYLYSLLNGKLIKKFGKDSGPITSLAVTYPLECKFPTIFCGSNDSSIRIYNFDEEEAKRIDLMSSIQCIEKNWGYLFVGVSSGQVYKIKTKNILFQECFTFSKNPIFSITATKEGPRKVLVVGARKESITIRDAFTGLLLRTFKYQFTTVYKIIIDKNLVYCGTNRPNIHVFQFQNGEKTYELQSGAGIVCLKIYFNIIFAGGYDGNIYIYLHKTKELISTLKCTNTLILSLEINDKKIIFGDKNGQIKSIDFPQIVINNLELVKTSNV